MLSQRSPVIFFLFVDHRMDFHILDHMNEFSLNLDNYIYFRVLSYYNNNTGLMNILLL